MNISGQSSGPSRREVLRLACGCAAGAASSTIACAAVEGAIDVHHHVSPPVWLEGAREQIAATNRNPAAIAGWTPSKSIEEMDQAGVASAMASVTNPGVWFGAVEPARKLARGCNEYLAKLKSDHPRRFGGMAAIPLPDTQGSLAEIEYALDTLRLDGIGLMSSYDNKWPGDAAFTPVLAELHRRKAVVFVHPTSSDCCSARLPDVSFSAIEFPIDTTRAVVSLLFSGALSRFPDIRWIFSHAGGAMPMLATRVAGIMESQAALKSRIPDGAMHELKRQFYDVALSANPISMAALRAFLPPSQILYGSDYPLNTARGVTAGLGEIAFTAAEARAISRGNAAKLFPAFG